MHGQCPLCRNAASHAERGPCLVCLATLGLREEPRHRHHVAAWSMTALVLLGVLTGLLYVTANRG